MWMGLYLLTLIVKIMIITRENYTEILKELSNILEVSFDNYEDFDILTKELIYQAVIEYGFYVDPLDTNLYELLDILKIYAREKSQYEEVFFLGDCIRTNEYVYGIILEDFKKSILIEDIKGIEQIIPKKNIEYVTIINHIYNKIKQAINNIEYMGLNYGQEIDTKIGKMKILSPYIYPEEYYDYIGADNFICIDKNGNYSLVNQTDIIK